jgi:hypothetical protein
MPTTVEILRAATEQVSDPARWCQNDYLNGVKACAAGAIWVGVHPDSGACMLERDDDPAVIDAVFRAVLKAAGETEPASSRDPEFSMSVAEEYLIGWNDADERTHEDIEAAFRIALANEESR